MSKNHLKSPPMFYFSGALSATLQNHLHESLVACAFPEHTRPFAKAIILTDSLFRSILGHHLVKSPILAAIKIGKVVWQEQSLT